MEGERACKTHCPLDANHPNSAKDVPVALDSPACFPLVPVRKRGGCLISRRWAATTGKGQRAVELVCDGHPVAARRIWLSGRDFSKLGKMLEKRLDHRHGRTEDHYGAGEGAR